MIAGQKVAGDIAAVSAESMADEWLRRLARPLIQLLAQGRPVHVEPVAQTIDRPAADVERGLRALPDVEWNDAGEVTGLGLTSRPTEHAMQIEGRTLYCWCAFDTLLFAALLERPVTIRSRDHATGLPVRITTTVDRIAAVDPPSTVVSWVGPRRPEELVELRASCCAHIHFFGTPAAAANWLAEHPDGTLLSVADADAVGKALTTGFFA
jgi:alkylmercury lyase